MKKLLLLILMVMPSAALADTKLTALTRDTTALATDLLYKADDPSGTPASRAITVGNLLNSVAISSLTQTIGNPGSFGSATQVPGYTVGADGRLTAASNTTISLTNSNLQSGAYSNVTGVGTQSQALNMNSHLVNNVTDPSSAQDAATKNYVDTLGPKISTATYLQYRTVNGTVTLTSADFGKTIICIATNAWPVYLPNSALDTSSQPITIMISTGSTNLVTVSSNTSADTIDGQSTRVMFKGESAVLFPNSGWSKAYGKSIPMLCTVRLTTNENTAANTNTQVLFNSTFTDNVGLQANLSDYSIVIKRPGNYLVSANTLYSGLGANDATLSTKVYLNGATANIDGNFCGLTGGFPTAPVKPAILVLIAGDSLILNVFTGNIETMLGTYQFLSIQEVPSW